ncbi:MAG TPA: lysylphosphatidylglycerol synthase transmembrane domain-containing protein [Gemmatimonadaceae bacterium]|nr:lysylphosphatidylglycerol synthase transmembrane domain-containing protein [Gemmatimonadaceae bacterium]
MRAATIELFIAAVAVLFVAHVLRASRHGMLFGREQLPGRFDLLLALSLSFALNTLLPFRIGELMRVLFISTRLRLRFAQVAATVAAERTSDLMAVALIAAAIAARSGTLEPVAKRTAIALTLAAIVMVAGALLVQRRVGARRVVWRLASVFNDRIRAGVVEFTWETSRLVVGGPIFSLRFLIVSVGMWGCYLAAYALLARSIAITFAGVTIALLGAPLHSLLNELVAAGGLSATSAALALFTAIPVVAVLAIGAVRQRQTFRRSWRFIKQFGLEQPGSSPPAVALAFRRPVDYDAFLLSHFSASEGTVSALVLEAMDDIVVHRFLPGGSDAVTAVVEVEGALRIRKLATGSAAEKLRVQAEWLRRHAPRLSMTEVISERVYPGKYHFDMPYHLGARDCYDVVHTAPVSFSEGILTSIIEDVADFHRVHASGQASPEVIEAYLSRKAAANASDILAFVDAVVDDSYSINGASHRLTEWDCLRDMKWLRAQIESFDTTIVHGDLTIENIIVCPELPKGWYLIDPNPENIFETPLIDWAKLMQSLNLGYESLNRGASSTLHGSDIRLVLSRSNAYAMLHGSVTRLLAERLGNAAMREVAFHELVNFLRLTPYKCRSSLQQGVTFFACTSLLLRGYRETYGV